MTPEATLDAPRASQARSGYIDPATLAELQRLAHSRPRSGRQSAAKASAIRTLERLERGGRRDVMSNDPAVLRLFADDRDPNEQVRPDDWHPGPPEMLELDAYSTVASRRRWYENLGKLGRVR